MVRPLVGVLCPLPNHNSVLRLRAEYLPVLPAVGETVPLLGVLRPGPGVATIRLSLAVLGVTAWREA